MKILLLIIISFILSSHSNAQSNYNNFNHYYGVQVNTGVTFFDLEPLKDEFNASVDMIRNTYNIPMEVQDLYPPNISWSAYLFWYISPRSSIVIGPEYTSTRAYLMYQDYAGTFDVKSEIKLYYLSIGYRVHFFEVPIIQPFMGLNAGVAQTDFEMDSELNINNGQILETDHSEVTDVGYSFEPYLGCTYDLKYVVLELVTAYKIVMLDKLLIAPDNFNIKLGVKVGVFK